MREMKRVLEANGHVVHVVQEDRSGTSSTETRYKLSRSPSSTLARVRNVARHSRLLLRGQRRTRSCSPSRREGRDERDRTRGRRKAPVSGQARENNWGNRDSPGFSREFGMMSRRFGDAVRPPTHSCAVGSGSRKAYRASLASPQGVTPTICSPDGLEMRPSC